MSTQPDLSQVPALPMNHRYRVVREDIGGYDTIRFQDCLVVEREDWTNPWLRNPKPYWQRLSRVVIGSHYTDDDFIEACKKAHFMALGFNGTGK